MACSLPGQAWARPGPAPGPAWASPWAMSGAAAALANVGPGLGDTIGPSSNYSTLSDFTKIMLSIGMLVGRLELYPLLILFSVDFWRN